MATSNEIHVISMDSTECLDIEISDADNSELNSEPDSVSNSEPKSESGSEPNHEPNLESNSEPNSEPTAEDFFTSEVQESENVEEPKPSCSRLHIKPQTKPQVKSRDIKPGFPWKFLLPKHGISKIIFQIVDSTEKRKGISLQGIKKSVVATGYDLEKRKHYFKRVLRDLLAKGLLKKLTGRGLTGSYAVSEMMRKVLWMSKNQRKRKIVAGVQRRSASQKKKRPRKEVKAIEPVIAPAIPLPCETAVAC